MHQDVLDIFEYGLYEFSMIPKLIKCRPARKYSGSSFVSVSFSPVDSIVF